MRLIDADAFKEYVTNVWKMWDQEDWYEAQPPDALKDDLSMIDAQPTIEVVPDRCGLEDGYYILKDGLFCKLDIKMKLDDAKTIEMPPIKLANS